MSVPRHASPGLEALGGGLSVAAALVVLARWLPLRFEPRPEALGILSPTLRAGYPAHQEPILFAAFAALGVLGVWLASGVLAGRRLAPAQRAGVESLALALLAAALWLPLGTATAAVVLGWATLGAWLGRAERVPRDQDLPASPSAPPAVAPSAPASAVAPSAPASAVAPSAARRALLVLGIVGLSVLRVPRLLQALQALAAGTPDAALTRNDWVFQAEDGQHLAWADALLHGGLHGRDFFCLYGPLYDWSVVGVWRVVGRSLAGWHLHVGLSETLAWIAFLSLAAWLVQRRWLLLPLAVAVPHLSLRIGWAFASLFFVFRYARSGRAADAGLAGLLAGVGLLYSQEFGLAAVVGSALVLAVRPGAAALGAWAGGATLALAPVLGFYAAAGALGPMLGDLVEYPALLMAGFGNLPFPSLRAALPLAPALDAADTRLLRLFYAVPAVSVVALGVSLPRRAPRLRRPGPWLRDLRSDWAARPQRLEVATLALFGLATYRTALGRSDAGHLHAVAAPAILLLAVACDRLLSARRRDPAGASFQLALGALLVFGAGFVTGTGGAGLHHLRNARDTLVLLARGAPEPRGHLAVNRVVDWLEAHSEPDDRFYFLPNDAALYYLTDRRPPTRFVVAHQMVTRDHRAEALADLRAAPPRYVVWNDATLRLDDFSDEAVLGPELWAWLHERYRPAKRLGGMRIWELSRSELEPSGSEPAASSP